MLNSAVVGLKPGADWTPLLNLAKEVMAPGSRLLLVSWVRVGVEEDEADRIAETQRRVEEVATELGRRGYDSSVHTGLIAVVPGAELTRLAADEAVDLIIIGVGKRSRVGKALLGSDAQRVLLSASCPVLSTRIE